MKDTFEIENANLRWSWKVLPVVIFLPIAFIELDSMKT